MNDTSPVATERPRPHNPLLSARILPTLMRLSFPNLFAMLATAIVAIAETSYIGLLGTAPLAAMALVFPMIMLSQMLSSGAMGGGVSSAISRAIGSGDLHRAMDDLKGMEKTFLESLRDASKAGIDVASTTVHALAEHAANSGSAVGRQVQASFDQLSGELGRTAQAQFRSSIDTGRATAALLARAASGFLAGIAEIIEAKPSGRPAREDAPSTGASSGSSSAGGSAPKG